MDLIGEEKRIQALFHEIKAQDHELTPPFARTWNVVESGFGSARRQAVSVRAAFTFPRMIAAALVIGSIVTVIVIRPWRLARQPVNDTSGSTRNDKRNFEAGIKPTSEAIPSPRPKSQKRNEIIAVVHRPTGKRLVARTSIHKDTKIELSRWESPTTGLLKFPGDELLKNSPALNQSAHEMRGFLSN